MDADDCPLHCAECVQLNYNRLARKFQDFLRKSMKERGGFSLYFWRGGEKNNVEFVDNQTGMGYNVDELGERYEDIAGRIA